MALEFGKLDKGGKLMKTGLFFIYFLTCKYAKWSIFLYLMDDEINNDSDSVNGCLGYFGLSDWLPVSLFKTISWWLPILRAPLFGVYRTNLYHILLYYKILLLNSWIKSLFINYFGIAKDIFQKQYKYVNCTI